MPQRITIEQIHLGGFRAFLREQTFSLGQGGRTKSLAIFAPNAKGKSSLVDAIEFFFSHDGTLERLGQRRSGTQAGPEALENIRAGEVGVTPQVTISFRDPSGTFVGTRVAAGVDRPRPEAAGRVLREQKLNFIVRGHELRRFVEDQTPQERYQEVSGWFGFSSLANVHRHMRELRLQIGAELADDRATAERLQDLRRVTRSSISEWDEDKILGWINDTQIRPLDAGAALGTLDSSDPSYRRLRAGKLEEDRRVGLAALREVISRTRAVYERIAEPGRSPREGGLLVEFEGAATEVGRARRKEKAERARSEKVVFKKVWSAARKIFDDPMVPIPVCPVCDTPLEQTAKRRREHIAVHLKGELDNLAAYSKVEKALENAASSAQQIRARLRAVVGSLQTALRSVDSQKEAEALAAYDKALEAWAVGQAAPDTSEVKRLAAELLPEMQEKSRRIEERQGERTYANAVARVDQLLELKASLQRIRRTRDELGKLHETVQAQEEFCAGEIRAYGNAVIKALRTEVKTLYCAVHAEEGEVPEIFLELSETRQAQLALLIGFGAGREKVTPSGYLSDSQLRTLALSLRLAAIQLFNRGAPIIVLDDVVISYDADHRKAIAAMFAEHFADFQLIIVTHDQRFFAYLKDHLPQANWIFSTITELDPGFGPRFLDHKVSDDVIEEKLDRGESAGNEIRQAEEEWLLEICRGFGVEVRIRDIHKPYAYDGAELAQAVHRFLKKRRVEVPAVQGLSNPFLISLQRGEVENFASHFQDDPHAFGSIGDEKRRWSEFKQFRDMFSCPDGHRKFKRPRGMEHPVCKTCEKPFALQAPASST